MLRTILLVFALLPLLAPPAFAGFEEGRSAYNRKDWVKAIIELRPLAEAGDDRAMILIANMYSDGFGVTQNRREALSLYRRAALEKNNPEAMLAIAAMYTSAVGIDQSLNTAAQWFLRAAQLGDQTGAFFYAAILFRGNKSRTDDLQPDFYNSYKWFRISAKRTRDPDRQKFALELAESIGKQKLGADEVAQANQEAADWKPVDAASLGPAPPEPATRKD